jgi:hypothetical protein
VERAGLSAQTYALPSNLEASFPSLDPVHCKGESGNSMSTPEMMDRNAPNSMHGYITMPRSAATLVVNPLVGVLQRATSDRVIPRVGTP